MNNDFDKNLTDSNLSEAAEEKPSLTGVELSAAEVTREPKAEVELSETDNAVASSTADCGAISEDGFLCAEDNAEGEQDASVVEPPKKILTAEGLVTREEYEVLLREFDFERECAARRAAVLPYKRTLVFALWGLLLSIFFGIGVVFSLVSTIMCFVIKSEEKSKTLELAKTLSFVGLVLNVLIITILGVFEPFLY